MSVAALLAIIAGTPLAGTPLAASANPTSVTGAGSGFAPETVTTGSTTVTAAGGVAPYTYNWVRVSGDANIRTTNPAAATTRFEYVNMPVGASASAIFRCTVTDAALATVIVEVTADLMN